MTKLVLDRANKKIWGVCAGLANWTGGLSATEHISKLGAERRGINLVTGEVRLEGRRSRKAEDPRVGRVDPVPEEALGHVDELEAVPCRGGRDDSFSGSSQSRV